MTLIIATEFAGVPVLLGDLLVSQQNNPKPHDFHLPTLTAEQLDIVLTREEYFPAVVDLQRKIVIINDQFAIAWTGTYVAAQAIVKGLFRSFAHKTPSLADLRIYFNSMNLGNSTECEIIGWIVGESKHSFRWASIGNQFSVDQHTYIEGSGAKNFKKWKFSGNINPSLTRYEKAIEQCLGITTTLIGNELLTGEAIKRLHGGGMEFVYLKDGKFCYPPKITYLFWRSKYKNSDDQDIEIIPHFIEYWYQGHDLVIRSTRLDSNNTWAQKATWNMKYPSTINIIGRFTKESIIRDTGRLARDSFYASYYSSYIFATSQRYEGIVLNVNKLFSSLDNESQIVGESDEESNRFIFKERLISSLKEAVNFAFEDYSKKRSGEAPE